MYIKVLTPLLIVILGLGLSFLPIKYLLKLKDNTKFILSFFAIITWVAFSIGLGSYLMFSTLASNSHFIFLMGIIIAYMLGFSIYVWNIIKKNSDK